MFKIKRKFSPKGNKRKIINNLVDGIKQGKKSNFIENYRKWKNFYDS